MPYSLRSRASARGDEAPSAATSPPGPGTASSPPETATVVGSASPPGGTGMSRAQAVAIPGMSVQVRPPVAPAPSVAALGDAPPLLREAAEAEAEILKLVDRIPDVAAVLAEVKKDPIVRGVLEDFVDFFPAEADRAIFYADEVWEEVSAMLMDAIVKYTPINEKDYDKKSKLYEGKKLDIVHKHVGSAGESAFAERGVQDMQKLVVGVGLFVDVGHSFVRSFQRLIIPPGETAAVSIPEQITAVLTEWKGKDPGELFKKQTAKHVYYIIGFLCHAGQKEAERRSKKKDIGRCIKALEAHFVEGRDKEAVAKIKEELPEGVTDLVDRRCHFGGLKYPNKSLYIVFLLMEKVYSTLATPYNFATFGGHLLGDICEGMLENVDIRALFLGLFQPDDFDDETIYEALRYYLKVFGNVRAKDLCYRYNSNIQKGATVGLRQRLANAAAKKKKGKKKQSAKKQKKSKQQEDEEEEKEEEESEEEPEASPEEQHEALLGVAAEEVASEAENRKICTIHQFADSHAEEE